MTISEMLDKVYGSIKSRSVMGLSLDGRILYANEFAKEFLCLNSETYLNSDISTMLIVSSESACWDTLCGNLQTVKDHYSDNLHIVKGSGIISFLKAEAFLLEMSSKKTPVVVLFLDPIITQKNNSNRDEKINDFIEISKELEIVKNENKVKTEFLSIAAHELKTPLTSIKGYSEILLDNMRDKLDPVVLKMVGKVNSAADRLHLLINSILDVTRIEQNRLRLKPEDISLVDIIQNVIDELSQFSNERNIRIKFKFPENIPNFYGDGVRMAQVFTNILGNALKFSKEDSLINITANYDDQLSQFTIITKDHGVGINSCELEKIFKPFYEVGKASANVKFMGGGSGLGLSIVKGVVEKHGGWVFAKSEGVDSIENPGTEMHIILPLKTLVNDQYEDTQEFKLKRIIDETTVGLSEESDNEPKTVLIIDNDVEAVEIAQMVLSGKYNVIVSDNGEDGIRKTFKYLPDLVLVDLYLPGLDGCQVSRILRSQDETSSIPIAFFTAATQSSEIESCFASGADEFIGKPFNTKEIEEKVYNLISMKMRAVPDQS